MNTLAIERREATAEGVSVTETTLTVHLADGRTLSVPLAWYPRLLNGSPKERNRWRLIGRGEGIHWPDLDEDISVENLLSGNPSGESRESFNRWLTGRKPQPRSSSRRPNRASTRPPQKRGGR
jgi:Protein of unknown function (DUF2442)